MKYFLLFAFLVGVHNGGQAPSAYAQQSKKPDPIEAQKKGDWVIARLDNHGGLCSVVRPFESNGTVLTFGKMPNGEYSIAFDVRKPDFNPSTSYNVSLQAGIGQVRSFIAKPVSKQVIVMNLGQDKRFFEALKTDQSFRVNINTKNYTYTLSEWSTAYNALESCSLGKELKTQSVQQANKIDTPAINNTVQSSHGRKQNSQKHIALKPPRKPVQLIAKKFAANESSTNNAATETDVTQKIWLEPVHAKEEILKDEKETDKLLRHAERQINLSQFSDKFSAKKKNTQRNFIEKSAVKELLPQNNLSPVVKEQAQSADIGKLRVLQERVLELEGYNEELEKQLAGFRDSSVDSKSITTTLEPVMEQTTAPGSQDKLAQAINRYEQSEKEVLRIGRLLREERQSCLNSQPEGLPQSSRAQGGNANQCERYREAEAEAAALKKRFAQSEKIAISMKAKMANMEGQITTLQATLKKNETELNREKARLAQAKESLTRADTTIAELQKRGERYEQSPLNADNVGASAEQVKVIGGLEKKVSLLEKRSEKYRTRISFLEQRLNEERTNYDSQIARLNSEVVALNYKVKTQREAVVEVKRQAESRAASIGSEEILQSNLVQPPGPSSEPSEPSEPKSSAGKVSAIEPASRIASNTIKLSPDTVQDDDNVNNTATQLAAVRSLGQKSALKKDDVIPSVTIQDISSLLDVAGVQTQGVQETETFSEKVESAYSWRSGSVEGYAEVSTIGGASEDFRRHIEDYVFTARSRCPGEFASVPLSRLPNLIAHDMACVSGMGDTTSSVLFYLKNGRFLTISHEADVEGIDIAMDVRDRILQSLSTQTSDL